MKRIRHCVRKGKGTEGKGMEGEVASVKHKKRGGKSAPDKLTKKIK